MTPKEKAKELVDKMYGKTPVRDEESLIKLDRDTARQCALIAVDEIINNDGFTRHDDYLTEYWQEVKQEIETFNTK